MTELSTDVKYGAIVFHDSSILYVNREQWAALTTNFHNPNLKDFTINENSYVKSAVAKILTLEELYEQYPSKRPAPKFADNFKKYEGLPSRIPIKGIPQVIAGLKRFIDEKKSEGVETPKAQELLDSWIKKAKKYV